MVELVLASAMALVLGQSVDAHWVEPPLMAHPLTVSQAPSAPQESRAQAEELYNQGVSFHQDGNVGEAIQAYEHAIELNPTLDSAYINLGILFISLDQLDQAYPLFQQVLTLPDRAESPASIHALAHYNLAIIESRQTHYAVALREIQQTLSIAPEFAEAQELRDQIQRHLANSEANSEANSDD